MGNPVTDLTIASAVLDSLVLLVFIFRMWIRVRMQRVGWEDIWAMVAFVCGTLHVVNNWVTLVKWGAGQSSAVVMWINMVTFTCILWTVRISIIFSVIRIIPSKEPLHRYGLSITALFLLMWSVLVVHEAITCSHASHTFQSTPSTPHLHCPLRSFIFEVIGSIGDIITVVFPLYVLGSLSLPANHLRLLRLLFLSNIAVSVLCAVRIASEIVPALARWLDLVTNLQIAACLLVCNLVVVVTYLYRVLGCARTSSAAPTTGKETTVDDDEDGTTLSARMTLTTIELLFSTQRSGEGASEEEESVLTSVGSRC